MDSKRNSCFELCRLICMFFIVFYHIYIHTSVFEITDGIFKALKTVTHIGVPVFIMISGYFGIKRKAYGLFYLLSQVVFYNAVCFLIAYFTVGTPITLDVLTQIFLPISCGEYWFVSLYVVLYLFAPYVNSLLNTLDNRQYLFYLGLLSFVVFYLGGIHDMGFAQERSIFTFVLAYSIGYYLRRFQHRIALPRIKSSIQLYVLSIVIFISLIVFLKQPYGRIINHLFFPYNSIGIFIMSVLFFMIFIRMHLKSRTINYLASSVFAIYLIHENKFIRDIFFYKWFEEWSASIPQNMLFLYHIIFTLIAIGIIICIDKIRQSLWERLKINYIIKKTSDFKMFGFLTENTPA